MPIVKKNLDQLAVGDWAEIDCFLTPSGTRIFIDYGLESNGESHSIYYYVTRREGNSIYLEPCLVKDETL